MQLHPDPATRGPATPFGGACWLPKNRVSRASTLASGRRRMDLSAQPPPSSSSQNGNGFEDVAGPNYNTPEPAPAARPSFAPAAGTVPSSRASHLTVGLPRWGGLISWAPVLVMALQKAWLKMGKWGSLPPPGGFLCWVPSARELRVPVQRGAGSAHGAAGTGAQPALPFQASTVPVCRR